MNISGIRPMENFYTYNVNRTNGTQNQPVQSVQPVQPVEEVQQQAVQVYETPAPEQKLTAYDYAQEYRPEVSYELKGANSNIHNLDMEKAISDMQKDQLLQQYQFFVSNGKQNAMGDVAVQAMRPIQNFTL